MSLIYPTHHVRFSLWLKVWLHTYASSIPECHVHPEPSELELICNQYFTGIGSGSIVFSCCFRRSHLFRRVARHNSSVLFPCHGSRITYMHHIWAQTWPPNPADATLLRWVCDAYTCLTQKEISSLNLANKTYTQMCINGYLPHTNPSAPNWFCVETVSCWHANEIFSLFSRHILSRLVGINTKQIEF